MFLQHGLQMWERLRSWQLRRSGGDHADLTAENEDDVWSRRLAAHPSCEGLHAAIRFYRSQGRSADAKAAQQRLDGCAPESTNYAQSLSEQGSHAQAAQSLQRLLAAAPLNRAALLMLVRELQMAGDDAGAQRAAAEWLRIAPNADNYHRLAANREAEISVGTTPKEGPSPTAEFYLPYRRDAIQPLVRPQAGNLRERLSSYSTIMLLSRGRMAAYRCMSILPRACPAASGSKRLKAGRFHPALNA